MEVNKNKMSRGYRNNNPCNIRCSVEKWQGEIVPSQDKAFKQFETMAFGFRATFKLLHNYNTKFGCKTLEQMINRFAPPIENNVNAYVTHVANASRVDPTSQLNTRNKDIMTSIVSAMALHENGKAPNQKDVLEGWDLFFK